MNREGETFPGHICMPLGQAEYEPSVLGYLQTLTVLRNCIKVSWSPEQINSHRVFLIELSGSKSANFTSFRDFQDNFKFTLHSS